MGEKVKRVLPPRPGRTVFYCTVLEPNSNHWVSPRRNLRPDKQAVRMRHFSMAHYNTLPSGGGETVSRIGKDPVNTMGTAPK